MTFIGFQFPQPCHRCVLRVCELVDGSYLEGLLRRVELAEQKRQLCVAVPGAVFEGVHEEKGGDEAKLNLRTKDFDFMILKLRSLQIQCLILPI